MKVQVQRQSMRLRIDEEELAQLGGAAWRESRPEAPMFMADSRGAGRRKRTLRGAGLGLAFTLMPLAPIAAQTAGPLPSALPVQVPGQRTAPPVSVADAFARAQADEASLQSESHAALVKAQSEALSSAMNACMPTAAVQTVPAFTVVLQLDGSGMPQQSWLQGDGTVAHCVENVLAKRRLFVPPRAPFYTFFELSFTP